MTNAAHDVLKSYIDRILRLEEERSEISAHIKDVMTEAKSSGFDTDVMRSVIKSFKMDDNERQEKEELYNLYMSTLGKK